MKPGNFSFLKVSEKLLKNRDNGGVGEGRKGEQRIGNQRGKHGSGRTRYRELTGTRLGLRNKYLKRIKFKEGRQRSVHSCHSSFKQLAIGEFHLLLSAQICDSTHRFISWSTTDRCYFCLQSKRKVEWMCSFQQLQCQQETNTVAPFLTPSKLEIKKQCITQTPATKARSDHQTELLVYQSHYWSS